MKVLRLAGLLVVAVVALGLVAASAASAELGNPLFKPVGVKIKEGSGGPSVLVAAGLEATCEENHVIGGEISNALLIGNFQIHYLKCVWRKGELNSAGLPISGCPATSIGAPGEGLILTNTLHAVLGLILPSRQTGLLFLPQIGKTFVTFAAGVNPTMGTGKCTEETAVTGNVAGAVTPVLQSTQNFTITIGLSGGVPTSKDFDRTHGLGLVVPNLVAFGQSGGLQQTDAIVAAEPVEIS